MKQDFNHIKKEILKKNYMIKSIYGGDNSRNYKGKLRRLETELDVLLYKYYKSRVHSEIDGKEMYNFIKWNVVC